MTVHLSKQRSYNAKRYRAWRKIGLCGYCGKHHAREGYSTCQACGDRNSKANRERRKNLKKHWKTLGICQTCGCRSVISGLTWCAVCAEDHTEHSRNRYRKNRSAGLCPTCGKTPDEPGFIQCLSCRTKRRLRSKE